MEDNQTTFFFFGGGRPYQPLNILLLKESTSPDQSSLSEGVNWRLHLYMFGGYIYICEAKIAFLE